MDEQLNLELRLLNIERDIDEIKRRSDAQDKLIAEELRELKRQYAKDAKEIKDRLDTTRDQLGMYRHFIVFIRSLLAGILIILTLRMGDIGEFLKSVTTSMLK